MNLGPDTTGDWDILGPSVNLQINFVDDGDNGWSLVLGPIRPVIPTGKRRPPELVPFKDTIVYFRGSLGLSLPPIEMVEVMASLGIPLPLLDDFLRVREQIGVPIGPEEFMKMKQTLNIIRYGPILEISMPVRRTELLVGITSKIWTLEKSKKKLKKIKEKLKSISTT